MTSKADASRLVGDLERIDGVERGLEDRLRRVLAALILARETQAHLQRMLHGLDGRADGRLRAARSADEDAQRFRELLVSMQTECERPPTLRIARSGSLP